VPTWLVTFHRRVSFGGDGVGVEHPKVASQGSAFFLRYHVICLAVPIAPHSTKKEVRKKDINTVQVRGT